MAHNPCSAGSKELLNNFKILTEQGIFKLLPDSRACTKMKKVLFVTLNQESIFIIDDQYFLFA